MENPLRRTAIWPAKADSCASTRTAPTVNVLESFIERKISILTQLDAESQPQNLLHGLGHAAFLVAACHYPAILLQFMRCISHDNRNPCKFKHFQVIMVVSNGHNLLSWNSCLCSPA